MSHVHYSKSLKSKSRLSIPEVSGFHCITRNINKVVSTLYPEMEHGFLKGYLLRFIFCFYAWLVVRGERRAVIRAQGPGGLTNHNDTIT